MHKTNVILSAMICVTTMVWAGSVAARSPQPMPPGAHTQSATTTNNQIQSPRDPCAQSQASILEYKDGEDGVNRTRPGNHKPGKGTQNGNLRPQNCWPVKH